MVTNRYKAHVQGDHLIRDNTKDFAEPRGLSTWAQILRPPLKMTIRLGVHRVPPLSFLQVKDVRVMRDQGKQGDGRQYGSGKKRG
jgi:hypothetical protein